MSDFSVSSNLIYLLSGMIFIFVPFGNLLTQLCGVSLCCLFYGSYKFHSTGERFGEKLDEISMYLVLNSLIALALWNLHHYPSWIALIAVPAITYWLWRGIDDISSFRVIGLQVGFLYSLLLLGTNLLFIIGSIALFGIAFIIRQIGEGYVINQHPLRTKAHYQALHGTWHILTNLAFIVIIIGIIV